jgi:uroporphyrinogen decarboxylase
MNAIDAAAAALAAETRRNGGLAPLDAGRFWAEQEAAAADPFGRSIPQLPLGIRMAPECVFGELGVKADYTRLQFDAVWRRGLVERYNAEALRIVGRPVLEDRPPSGEPEPGRRHLHDLFEADNRWQGDSYWLMRSASTPEELARLLDRVEARLADHRTFAAWLLGDGWKRSRDELARVGLRPKPYRSQRGPVTFATSVYGVENLIYLLLDAPALAARLRDLILRGVIAIAETIDAESGADAASAPRGWYWLDDNCALLSPDLYRVFGYPILEAVFARFSPDPGDLRGQHSDSEMAHLLPLLARLGLNDVNFGPKLTVAEIRAHLPRAVIHGQLAPFTFSRDDSAGILRELLRDFEQAGDARGLVFETAGSVNDGSRLAGLRLVMSAIQRHCRY